VLGTTSAFAERIGGNYYLNIVSDRAELARNGVSIADFQKSIGTALGGEAVTTTVERRQRYSVNLRHPRGFRSDPDSIAHEVLIDSPTGAAIPLGSSPGSSSLKAHRPSGPRTHCSRFTSMSRSAARISAAMSPRPSRRSSSRSSSRLATSLSGAVNSSI
jgi:hypothetical protein